MKVDRIAPELPPTFQHMYLSLAASKEGFKSGWRPLVGLDGSS